jgi:hypothetical protein
MDEGFDEDYLEVVEPNDNDYYKKEENFSHPALVMTAYRRALVTLAMELKKGYWETKTDKYGNQLNTYHNDTRLDFINSVEALRIVMVSDYDNDAKTKIDTLMTNLNTKRQALAVQEHQWFITLQPSQRNGMVHVQGYLNQDLHFYQFYVEEQVSVYKQMFEEIELLLKRSHYLKKEMVVM